MQKIDKKIEIVRSSVPRLSSMSQPSAEAIMTVLADGYADVRITIITTTADLDALVARQPELVFLGLKYMYTNNDETQKIWVSDYLETRGVACTGSDQYSHLLEADKSLAKHRINAAGLRTSKYQVVKIGDRFTDLTLQYPLFIKPTDRGGGQGIDGNSIVSNIHELQAKIDSIAQILGADSLVEEYLPGREFSVALLRDESSYLSVMPVELTPMADARGVRILGHAEKNADQEKVTIVSDLPLKAKITDLALAVFAALGARDYGRIDIRLDQFGEPHFLEANLIPSLIENYGSFPKACLLNDGPDYQAMILSIARSGMVRA